MPRDTSPDDVTPRTASYVAVIAVEVLVLAALWWLGRAFGPAS